MHPFRLIKGIAFLLTLATSASAATYNVTTATNFLSSTFSGISDGDVINISATLTIPNTGSGCDKVRDFSTIDLTINILSGGSIDFGGPNTWLVLNETSTLSITGTGTLTPNTGSGSNSGIILVNETTNTGYVYATPGGSTSSTPPTSCISTSLSSIGTGNAISFSTVISNGGISPPVPVSWMHFEGKSLGKGLVELKWATASESNNSGFTIEYSINNKDWTSDITVPSLAVGGNSNEVLEYKQQIQLSDQTGVVYFRILQTDFDGKSDYSSLISIQLNQPDLKVWNTGNLQVSIHIQKASFETSRVRLFGVDGQIISDQNGIDNVMHMSFEKAGVYVILVEVPGKPALYRKLFVY